MRISMKKTLAIVAALAQIVFLMPLVATAAVGDTIASLDFTTLGNSTVTENNGTLTYIQLATGANEGKLEAKTSSTVSQKNRLENTDFAINGGSFNLNFDAQFNSLVANVHASYWNMNGLGVQLSYRDGSNNLKTCRVNFTKLDTVNNKVNVVVAKGGASFPFYGAATNFTNMTVDLPNPTANHAWTFNYDSSANTLSILVDGVKIKSSGTELAAISNPWVINTNVNFTALGLSVTNVIYSTSASYITAGSNNDVLLDNFVLKEGTAQNASITAINNDTWTAVYEGYADKSKQYTITNGAVALNNLNVSNTGSDFVVENLSSTTLAASGTATFNVRLPAGKAAGTYSTTVSVKEGSTVLGSFVVAETVYETPSTTKTYDCTSLTGTVVSGNTASSVIELGSGATAGKLHVMTASEQLRTNGFTHPGFAVSSNNFRLNFDAQFSSLIDNKHASYWLYNGLGIQLSYADAGDVLKTYRITFNQLDTVNNTVVVTVGRGGQSFNFAGPSNPNWINMVVDLPNPTANHTWSMEYDADADMMTIYLDGNKITNGGLEIEAVSNPWFINTNTAFNSVGLMVTNVLFSTNTSYVGAGTNNNVLLDNFALQDTIVDTPIPTSSDPLERAAKSGDIAKKDMTISSALKSLDYTSFTILEIGTLVMKGSTLNGRPLTAQTPNASKIVCTYLNDQTTNLYSFFSAVLDIPIGTDDTIVSRAYIKYDDGGVVKYAYGPKKSYAIVASIG